MSSSSLSRVTLPSHSKQGLGQHIESLRRKEPASESTREAYWRLDLDSRLLLDTHGILASLMHVHAYRLRQHLPVQSNNTRQQIINSFIHRGTAIVRLVVTYSLVERV